MNEQQRRDIDRQAAWILGDVWRRRRTADAPHLSDEIGLVLCFEHRRGPGSISVMEKYAMDRLWRLALDIEYGRNLA